MDAFVQLALIEKAKRVFSDDSKVMLSFPLLAPLSFTAEELSALSAPQTAADYANAAEFSRVVNFLPRDMVAQGTERTLWQVFADVLARAQVAAAPAATAQTPAASILYDVTSDGIRIESLALKRYRQYRDAWITAREDYGSHKLTGELSEDPAVRQRWLEVDEPRLQAALTAAKTDWDTLGNRVEIELAIQMERDDALRDPRLRWAQWTHDFNPDTDLLTEGNGGKFAPTGLSPRDFATAEDWLFFEMSSDEMAALVAEAPAQFRAILDNAPESRFERISFEYRSVGITRPWYNPSVLTSQIWRTSDPEIMLSDGSDPASGACPAYATAIVFMRNLKVVERGSSTEQPFKDLRFTLDHKLLVQEQEFDPHPLQFNPGATIVMEPAATLATSQIRETAFVRLQSNSFSVLQRQTAVDERRLTPVSRVRVTRRAHFDATRAIHINPAVFGEAPGPIPPVPPAAHPEISILAFICKRLPKAPDPDPTLHWR